MVFFLALNHKKSSCSSGAKSYYSAHLSLDVHCSSQVKKKRIFYYTLSLLSLNKHFPFSISGFTSFFFLPPLSSSSVFFLHHQPVLTAQLPAQLRPITGADPSHQSPHPFRQQTHLVDQTQALDFEGFIRRSKL